MNVHLRPLDLTVVALYLVGITLFGLRFRKKSGGDKSLRSYFLADNTIPWWAIALSIVSAETSTLTVISIPGVAFAGDFGFLQIVLGYMLGRVAVAALFLPRYFRGEMMTAYQLIDQRFGGGLHKVTAGLFLLTRAAAEGVRVFAVSIVVGIAIGTRDVLSIGIISALTLLYTFEGGMAAVIWTDVVQMVIYVGGTVVAILTLGHKIAGGWSTIHAVAGAAGKFHMFDFALNLTSTYTFWAGILGGTFLTMASHGTDQLMVQRMLAARNLRESRLALLSSGIVIFVQFGLFLLIGAGLFVFYGLHPAAFASSDRIFPTFIVREMPIGIAGLLVAAILAAAMSNLSAALNSLSSTTVVDFYMRLRPRADDRERTMLSKASTVLWALVLFAIAVATVSVGGKGHVVEIGLSIASVAYGCLLGVFLLGTLTKFATQTGATIGMVCGFVLNLWLWQATFPVRIGRQPTTTHTVVDGNSFTVTAHYAGFTIPHIAWTWYVLIGALVTFAIGALCSLVFGKQAKRTVIAALLLLCLGLPKGLCVAAAAQSPVQPTTADFTPISTLLNDAITAHKLPGGVVLIGHDGKVVFEQAYGDRKLAGEPGIDGKASPAERMTEDTIFDMASLTKCLATATAVMQLYEQGKIGSFDDPVEKYLPAFNAHHDERRAKVTLRMLLTHTSGEAPDVDLKDPWGLAAPDRAEGFRRALTTALKGAPGAHFEYSDINFILLGALVEKISGVRLQDYATRFIFQPLRMRDTSYHEPPYLTCPDSRARPYGWVPPESSHTIACNSTMLMTFEVENPRVAPTAHDNEGTAATNPDFDRLLRGTVHDPTTRRMGGVAGHAGVFSTAQDVSLFAAALLEKLLHNAGPFPLKQSTLQMMIEPEQPGRTPEQVHAAESAEQAAIAAGDKPAQPGLAPHYPAIKGQDLRGFGWDIDTAFSKPRGEVFPIGSFGHTGFTGTSLWMDRASDTYVILLANAIHPRGNPPISNLRGQVATAAARALGLGIDHSSQVWSCSADCPWNADLGQSLIGPKTLTGIDVLEATHFTALANYQHLGIFTNQSGLDANGHRTIDVLYKHFQSTSTQQLTAIFTPEHGLSAQQDTTHQQTEKDQATHLPVISLYGAHDADRRPTHAQLAGLDAVVIDLQDAGVHFWTYEAAVGYFLEAASTEQTEYHHAVTIVLLDRPNPVGGVVVQGPVSDAGHESYVNYMPLPVRHGMTFGELARYIVATKHLSTTLRVVPMQHWQRGDFYDDTGLPWVNPSPNLRSAEAALRYPALGLIEYNNLSVGRGTDHPFSFFGAGISTTKASTSAATGGLVDTGSAAKVGAWFNASEVAQYLTARNIPGVSFSPGLESIAEDANHYPYHGQTIEAVRVVLTDPKQNDTPELGIEILAALHHLYPTQFNLPRAMPLVCSKATMDALTRGDDPRSIAATWTDAITVFKSATAPFLLYP